MVRLGEFVDALAVGTDYDVTIGGVTVYRAFKGNRRSVHGLHMGGTGEVFDDFEVKTVSIDSGTVVFRVARV